MSPVALHWSALLRLLLLAGGLLHRTEGESHAFQQPLLAPSGARHLGAREHISREHASRDTASPPKHAGGAPTADVNLQGDWCKNGECIQAPTINIRVSGKTSGRHRSTENQHPLTDRRSEAIHGGGARHPSASVGSAVGQDASSLSAASAKESLSLKKLDSGFQRRHGHRQNPRADYSEASVKAVKEHGGLSLRGSVPDKHVPHSTDRGSPRRKKANSRLSASSTKSNPRRSSELPQAGRGAEPSDERQGQQADGETQRPQSTSSHSKNTKKAASGDKTGLGEKSLPSRITSKEEERDRNNGRIDSELTQSERKKESTNGNNKGRKGTFRKSNEYNKDSNGRFKISRSSLSATTDSKDVEDAARKISPDTEGDSKVKPFTSEGNTDRKDGKSKQSVEKVRLSNEDGQRRSLERASKRPSAESSDISDYPGDVPRRPAAADRLERRTSPRLGEAARTLLESINHVMDILGNQMYYVHSENDFVFNGTRYNIMIGVRNQLQEIAKANDMSYDAVLRATLVTKDIYMRAHQGRLTGPTTRSLSRPEMNLPSLYSFISRAYAEERLAVETLREVENYKRQLQKVQDRLRQIRENFQSSYTPRALRAVVRYVNMTNHKLRNEFSHASRMRYGTRNTVILGQSRDDLVVARDLLVKADESLAKGAQAYRGNYGVVQDFLRLSADDQDDVGPPVSLRTRPEDDDITADERRQILQLIDSVREHAREQERRAGEIERMLRPAVQSGRRVATREHGRDAFLLTAISDRLATEGKKLFSMLETIRVLIGGQHELRWRPPTLCHGWLEGSGDDDDEDETGCGSGSPVTDEGSGLNAANTDDEDFVFVEEKKPVKCPPRSSSLPEFGEKLSVHLDGVKLRSNDVVQRADQVYDKTNEVSKRWETVKESTDDIQKALKTWKVLKPAVQSFALYASNISDKARDLSKRVNRLHDGLDERMERVVRISERALAAATVNKTGQPEVRSKRDQPTGDETVIIEAFQKVNEVRSNKEAISNLRRVLPRSCDQATRHIQALNANISHLRLQVQRARALLQSMQLSISKTGSSYLSIPVLTDDVTPSLTMTVDLCVKTEANSGAVLFIKGKAASMSLSVETKKASVTTYDADGKVMNKVSSDLTLLEDKWYDITVSRTGSSLSLRVASQDGKEVAEKDVRVSNMPLLQSHPVHAYVGGVSENEPFSLDRSIWTGCLGGLKVNGQAVSLLHTSSKGEVPQLCTTQCSDSQGGSSLVFEGTGFLHFPVTLLPQRRTVETVHFRFRSLQPSAALLHVVNQRQRFLLRVVLDGGAVMIDTTTPSESVILRSRLNTYNNGSFHTLKIKYSDSTTYPELDGMDGAFTIEKGTPRSLTGMADGVVAAAFVNSQHVFETSSYRPLIGCLQGLEIDNKSLSEAEAKHATGVFVGTCGLRNVWSSCVHFNVQSKGVDLGTFDRSDIVAVLFSPNARGPLLSYSREGKFDVEISSEDSGLRISTGDEDVPLTRPAGITEPLSLLTITDDGKNVRYKAWEQSQETNYAGFWSIASDVNAPHGIAVGPALNDPQRSLVGDVAQLVIGNRYISLTNYTVSHNLQTCQPPLPDFVTSETTVGRKLPVVAGADLPETCSLDIAC